MTKAGLRLEVLLNATTRRDGRGNIIGVVGIGQDITGRLAQEREYTRLIDTANAPIFGVDTRGRVSVWNKCATRLLGYGAEEVVGRSLVQEFITDDFKTAVQAVLDLALVGDETGECPAGTAAAWRRGGEEGAGRSRRASSASDTARTVEAGMAALRRSSARPVAGPRAEPRGLAARGL